MTNRFLRFAVAFYVGSISLGLVLRLAFVQPLPWLPFKNALHAHSHTLFFGWAGLAVTALWFQQLRLEGRGARAALWSLVAIAVATFVTFLHGGYSPPAMAVSTLALGVWGWIGVLLWRSSHREAGLTRWFVRVAVGHLALAIAGAVARVVILAARVEEPAWGLLAVFGFIHNFGWFLFFAVAGLIRAKAAALGLSFRDSRLRTFLVVAGASAWLTFPLGVSAIPVPALEWVARAGSLVVALSVAAWAWEVWRAARSGPAAIGTALRWLALWSGLHAAGELCGALGIARMANALRQPVILYLHIFLVGVVSLALFTLVAHALGKRPVSSRLQNGGLGTMALGLAATSAHAVIPSAPGWVVPWGFLVAFAGAVLLVAGALVFVARPARLAIEARVAASPAADGARDAALRSAT